MENHHLSAAFALLQEPSLDFMEGTPAKARGAFRKQVIEAVLATDMKQHFSLVSLFNTKFSAPAPVSGEGSRSRSFVGAGVGSVAGKSVLGGNAGLDRVKMDDELRSLVMQARMRS